MPTQNNNQPNYFDSALLANDVYQDPEDRAGANSWSADVENITGNFDSGLQVQNYQSTEHPNHTAIAIAGTNGLSDLDDNLGFVTGELTQQMRDALDHTARTIERAAELETDRGQTTFSVVGHSLGGGLAQVVAHSFSIGGVAIESPGAASIVASQDYQDYISELQENYPNVAMNNSIGISENFTNISEQGSIVGNIGIHLGDEISINATSDVQTGIGQFLVASPNTFALGLGLIADSLVNNHSLENAINYLEHNYENLQQQANPLNNFQNQLTAAELLNNDELADTIDDIEQGLGENNDNYDDWFNDNFDTWFYENFDQEQLYIDKHDELYDDKYFDWYHEQYAWLLDDKYAEWYDDEHQYMHDEKYDEWIDDKYAEWYDDEHQYMHDEKYDEWIDDKYDEWIDEKYNEWYDDEHQYMYDEKYDEWIDDKYDEWYSDQHWDTYDEMYNEWRGDSDLDDEEYDEWFGEHYDEWFDSEYYGEWFDEHYDEWFDEHYDEWFDEEYDIWFDEEYDEWFDEEYDIWFDGQYDEWFDEEYDIWFDGQYDEEYDIWFDGQYDEWFDGQYDEWFDEEYDIWFDEEYDEWFDSEYEQWFDENFNQEQLYMELYAELYDEKYDEWFEEYAEEYNFGAPIIMDMDGDGIELVALNDSNTFFDFDNDGFIEHTAWTTTDDALLMFDEGNDGQITNAREIAFSQFTAEDDTDLEALATQFDSNNDGVLNNQDTDFNGFRVWQDVNANGAVDENEIQSLAEAGISSINLTSDNNQQTLADGTTIFGQTTYTRDDGTIGAAADVAFKYENSGYQISRTEGGFELNAEQGSNNHDSYFHNSDNAANINLNDNNYDIATGGNGNDILDASTTNYNTLISGGDGDDTLTGGSGADMLIGGSGSDTIHGGAGNDTIVVDDSDILDASHIQGGEGYDKLLMTNSQTTTVNVDDLGIESVEAGNGDTTIIGNNNTNYNFIGGDGNDNITSGSGSDVVYGGSGNDDINSGGGDDYVSAGSGDDNVNAGDGDDVIYGGAGNDTINAGTGDDVVYLEGDGDIITGGAGADTFRLSSAQNNSSGLINIVQDFTTGEDKIDLTAFKNVRSMSDINISSNIQNGVSYTQVQTTDGNNTINLAGVNPQDLTQENFDFYNHAAVNLSEVNLTTDEDQNLIITEDQLLTNAIDVDGDTISVQNLNVSGSDATLTNNNNGTWTLVPNANFNGQLELSYEISDGYETTSTTAGINISQVNDAPTISSIVNLTTDEDQNLIITQEQLLANASDIDGDTLNVQNLNVNGNATLTNNNDGTWTLNPNENYNGQIELSYDISDGIAITSTTANIDVAAVNDAAVNNAIFNLSAAEDQSLTITQEELLEGATDVDGDELNVQNLSVNGNATLTNNNDGTWTLNPNENYNGQIELSYDISDGIAITSTTANIDVAAVNDAAVNLSTVEDSSSRDRSLIISERELLANAIDADGDNLSVENLSIVGDNATLIGEGRNLNNNIWWIIAPNSNFNGQVELSYDISDGYSTTSTTANINLKETLNNINTDVELTFTEYNFATFGSVVGEIGTSGDQDWVRVEMQAGNMYQLQINSMHFRIPMYTGHVSSYSNKSLESPVLYGIYDSNGILIPNTYDASNPSSQLDFVAPESGIYYVSAGSTNGNTGNYEISAVRISNDKPVNNSVAEFNTNEDQSLIITQEELLEGATDDDDDELSVQNLSINGNATLTNNNDGTWTLNPNENYNGQIELSYDISDGIAITSTTANIDVAAVNDAAVNNAIFNLSAAEDQSLTITQEELLEGATDVDGDELNVQNLSVNGNATLTNNNDGTWTLNPNENYNGQIELSYDISDGIAITSTTANIDISEMANNITTTAQVEAGNSISGSIGTRHDQDWVRVELDANTRYQIDLEGSRTGGGTLRDTYIRGVYDENGNSISGTHDDDGGVGSNSRLDFSTTEAGTYYISAGAYSSYTGTYTLSIDNGVEVAPDVANNTSTTASLTIGDVISGEIDTSYDQDWFRVVLDANTNYQIDLEGSVTGGGTLRDTYLRGVYDENGNSISGTYNDDGGVGHNSQVNFTSEQAGDYFISAGAYSSNTGSYSLSIDDMSVI